MREVPAAKSHSSLASAATSLHGRPLILAWGLSIGMAGVTLFVFLGSLPLYFAQLQTVCASAACITGQPAPDTAQALQRMGLSLHAYATLAVALNLITVGLACGIGALLLRRRPKDWLALLVALMLLMVSTTTTLYTVLQQPSAWQALAWLVNLLAFGALFFVTALLPDGRFAPRWTCWLGISWLAWSLGAPIIFRLPYISPFMNLVWLAELAGLIVALVARYRLIANPVQRQQIKWVVFGWAATIGVGIAANLPELLAPTFGQPGSLYDLSRGLVNSVLVIPSILSIAIAVLRYRLWDIDVLINRTLVYGALTVTLGLLYLGGVALLQRVSAPLTGSSNLAIVGSTLTIATLFNPLRQRIQSTIDGRFYRRKYDAARTLTAFGARMRDEVELQKLSEDLLRVVEETLQPTQVTLWLREPQPKPPRGRAG